MSGYRTRNQLLLAEIEAASGTEETPTVADNAVRVRFPIGFSPSFDAIEPDFVNDSLSQTSPIIGGGMVGMDFGCYLKGAGTGGEAPDHGPLLRACGLEETLTAAAVTGTASAGGASTITLDSESSTDDAYVGMVIRLTGGTGSGQSRVITDYVGSTGVTTVTPPWTTQPDNTSQYSIDANALYRPRSSALETVTLWAYQHATASGVNSRRRRLVGGAGNFSIAIQPRGLAELRFGFRGLLPAVPDDVSNPAAPTYESQEPEPFINALAYLGSDAVKFSDFSFDIGNDIQMFDNPAATYGFDVGAVNGRRSSGRITPELVLTSTRNAFSDWLASTSKALWLRWGSAAGKRVSILLPAIRYVGNEPADTRGFATEGLPFRATGQDSEIYICVH